LPQAVVAGQVELQYEGSVKTESAMGAVEYVFII
jgi:hypothetical protein